ncbi:hypothetical protein AD939_01510 [Gluconobacter oxydans]|nr:hypothetical protein AD939_01510 [Gluconobacter oxydans]
MMLTPDLWIVINVIDGRLPICLIAVGVILCENLLIAIRISFRTSGAIRRSVWGFMPYSFALMALLLGQVITLQMVLRRYTLYPNGLLFPPNSNTRSLLYFLEWVYNEYLIHCKE